mgnify:CR=1 FL=1
MKVLVAVDGSVCSQAAVATVAARPWPAGTEIKLLSVAELQILPTSEFIVLPPSYYDDMARIANEQAGAALKAAVETMQKRATVDLKMTTEQHTGIAKSVILDEAEKWGADLIVVGSHGYKGMQRFLLGSVSQAVATHATCSVEIVRAKQAAK